MRKTIFRVWGPVAVVIGMYCVVGAQSAYAQTCPAVPNDGVDDDSTIQTCLNNATPGNLIVSLAPGVYNIRYGLRIRVAGTIFTSSNPPARPRLVADPELSDQPPLHAGAFTPILATDGPVNNFEISHMTFDGNRFNRNYAWTCDNINDYNPGGSNVILKGSGFVVKYVESTQTLCGSSLEVSGDGFFVYDSVFTANGFADGTYYFHTFADGLTAQRCDGGTIWNNDFVDNTDVDLVVFRGNNCVVRFNDIQHVNQYGFAGLGVGHDNAYLSGATISDNTISSGYNLLSIGLALGHHPWEGGYNTYDIGNVSYNSITGAVINVLVEGVYGGTITNNSAWSPQGDRGYAGCTIYGNVIAGHWGGGLTLQTPDTVINSFDTGVCVP